MAAVTAKHFAGHPVTAIVASPLQRAQESAQPWAEQFGLEIRTEERIIEPENRFEGGTLEFGPALLLKPRTWPLVVNPFRPSWGEPFASIAARMLAAIDDAFDSVENGEVVMVSHQSPIVMVQRSLAGKHLWHDPRDRRCSLSSVTTVARNTNGIAARFVEVAYSQPAADLLARATDTGAV